MSRTAICATAAGTLRVRETFGITITHLASRMAIDLH